MYKNYTMNQIILPLNLEVSLCQAFLGTVMAPIF